jgi:hypothetical protein
MIEVRNGAIIVTNKYDPKRKRSMTKKKAEKILKHGKVKGKKVTPKQKRFLYAKVPRPPVD